MNRADVITKALKVMPEKLKKAKEEKDARKPKKDIFYMFKRIAEISRKKERR